MTERTEHPRKESALELDLKTKKALMHLLAGEAKMYEGEMPNVTLGAICTGNYLTKSGYTRVGLDRMFKKERTKKGDVYLLFRAVREVESQTVTAVPEHPFYELEAME